ncbi:MAG: VWA domain-containing protein [Myxococcota bacterium]
MAKDTPMRHVAPWFLLFAFGLLSTASRAAPPRDEDQDLTTVYEFADVGVAGEMMSATPGGAQDIAYFRDRVSAGEIPNPEVFTPEGLFSEHDLPLAKRGRCRALLCIEGEATEGRLLAQPDVRFIGQLGFSTNIDAAKFLRAPTNLVAVVDKSGSMTDVLPLVQESLREVVNQLGPRDQLSIVLYGEIARPVLRPTRADASGKERMRRVIDQIQSGGSTAMEDGMQTGFRIARRSGRGFAGQSRLMLFTDERPNVGATDRHSFMAMARNASRAGIGMTTVGVGVQFGAELATAVSSVRGGNLFFFPDADEMTRVFEEDFDTMVSELAHDLRLRVTAAPGMKLAGLYGIPGDMLRWTRDGALEVEISTVFLSRRAGAIYVAVAPSGNAALPRRRPRRGAAIATVDLSYTPVEERKVRMQAQLTRVPPRRASVGLARGLLLVDQITALKKAVTLHHHENDQEGAYQLVHALAGRFRHDNEPSLGKERKLVLELERTLAKLSGHRGEPVRRRSRFDDVSGLPLR